MSTRYNVIDAPEDYAAHLIPTRTRFDYAIVVEPSSREDSWCSLQMDHPTGGASRGVDDEEHLYACVRAWVDQMAERCENDRWSSSFAHPEAAPSPANTALVIEEPFRSTVEYARFFGHTTLSAFSGGGDP